MITPATAPGTTTQHTGASHTAALWLAASAGALGGLLFGYDWVVIGGAKPFYEAYFHLNSPALQGWAMSCALLGCLTGALAAGGLSDRWGRKRLLILAALVFALSSLGTGMAGSFTLFVMWRVLGGCAIGLASGVSPMYIAEIAPAHLRGRLVSLNQVAIVSGILLAQIVNWLIARPVPAHVTTAMLLASWNGQWGWRWMFGVTAIPSLLFLLAASLVPESPRWLATRSREPQALRVLERLGNAAYARQVLDELRTAGDEEPAGPLWRELAAPGVGKALLLGVTLAVLQQWCGINVIFNYAQEIFAAAGYQISGILFNIVITGATNVLFTFVALATVDRLGRRILLLGGAAGLALIYAVLGLCYHLHLQGKPMLALVLAAIACYSMSLAPVTWVVIAEIFPNRIRGGAMSIAVASLWVACFALTYLFPVLNAALSTAGVFWVFTAVCLVGWLFLYRRLPETRGKSLEEIETALRRESMKG